MAYFPSLQVPAGVIFDYGGLTAPTGWLICDGSSKVTASYPTLASTIRPALPAMNSVASNVITFTDDHNMTANEPVVFLGGTAPSGLTSGVVYFVRSSGLTTSAFSVSATRGGSAETVSSIGSGSTAYAAPFEVLSGSRTALPGMSSVASNLITFSSAHGRSAGDTIIFLGGTAPNGTTSGTVYYVIASGLTSTQFKISTSSGGSALTVTSVGSGSTAYYIPNESGTGISASSFLLPDFRGVSSFGKQASGSLIDSTNSSVTYPAALGYNPGTGLSTHTLSNAQTPLRAHTHENSLTFNLSTGIGSNNAYAGGPGQTTSAYQKAINGSVDGITGGALSGSAHNNMPPTIIINKIISTGGV